MPYVMRKKGNSFCVMNESTGDNKGCSDSRKKAAAHMRALYAAESKTKEVSDADFLLAVKAYNDTAEPGEIITPDEIQEVLSITPEDLTKDYYPGDDYPTYSYATSYADLEAEETAREAAMKVNELISQLPMLVRNAFLDPTVTDKGMAIEGIAKELADRLPLAVKEEMDEQKEKAAISKRSDVSQADKKSAVAEYGNVTYADPKNKKYPIDSEKHIRAAWSYIGMPKNQAKYSSEEVAAIKRRITAAWKSKIDKAGPPAAAEKSSELSELYMLAADIMSKIDLMSEPGEEKEKNLMIWKEKEGDADIYFWIARYSNKFRDNDRPAEIISEGSHRTFVDRVEKGIAPPPELWLWHNKEWKIGRGSWVGFDDSGFAMAAGRFDPGTEQIAEWLSLCSKELAVSHGMPPHTVVYDPKDSTIIIEHETREISPLPRWAAANPLTGFAVLKELDSEEEQAPDKPDTSKEDENMPIPVDQKKALLAKMGLSEKALDEIEKANAKLASKAAEAGIDSKEKTDAQPPADSATSTTPATETPKAEATPEAAKPEETPAESKEKPLTRQEIADAIISVLTPLSERLEGLETMIKEVSTKSDKANEEMVAKAKQIGETPLAGILELINARSAVKSKEAEVKPGDPLVDQKPKETPVTVGPTGIPFIDTMLTPQGK